MKVATMLTVAVGPRVRIGGVQESRTHVLVKMLVSMVNLTMLTRAWLLKRPSILLSLNSYNGINKLEQSLSTVGTE
jgi:hypothetical protein